MAAFKTIKNYIGKRKAEEVKLSPAEQEVADMIKEFRGLPNVGKEKNEFIVVRLSCFKKNMSRVPVFGAKTVETCLFLDLNNGEFKAYQFGSATWQQSGGLLVPGIYYGFSSEPQTGDKILFKGRPHVWNCGNDYSNYFRIPIEVVSTDSVKTPIDEARYIYKILKDFENKHIAEIYANGYDLLYKNARGLVANAMQALKQDMLECGYTQLAEAFLSDLEKDFYGDKSKKEEPLHLGQLIEKYGKIYDENIDKVVNFKKERADYAQKQAENARIEKEDKVVNEMKEGIKL